MLEPMVVTVHTEPGSSWVEPAYDEGWLEIDKVRWLAGTTQARTGIKVRVDTCDRRGLWSWYVGSSSQDASFDYAWTYLMGFMLGVEQRDHQLRKLAEDRTAVATPLIPG